MNAARRLAVLTALCALAAMFWAGSAPAAISGTVTDGTSPIGGIEVCSESAGPISSGNECSQTDSAGEYTLPAAGPGHWVHFYTRANVAPGYAPQWYPGVAHRAEAEGVTEAQIAAGVDAVMGPGGSIAGTVEDAGNGNPIEGVEVCPNNVVFEEGRVTFCAKTNAEGNYALRGLETGNFRLEFRTDRNVNYVEELFPSASSSFPLTAGSSIQADLKMVPGVEIEGDLTEAGTGSPVVGLLSPFSVVTACALNSATQEKVKCAIPDLSGHYSIPGLPPGRTYAVGFAIDGVEEGLDLARDGYVRQYWDRAANFDEAALIAGSGRSIFGGVNAVLSRGEEVWPNCELPSACAPPPPGGEPSSPALVPSPTAAAPTLSGPAEPVVHCHKGFVKVTHIAQTRCVKMTKKPRRRKHHKPRRHHRRTTARLR